ncbi:MAG: iron-sulfur cluster assembly scaffold protein, partial [Planctomycetaceae bacterium]
FGGGNMGSRYMRELEVRRRAVQDAVARGIPIVVLPQSWMSPEPGPFARAYVRERASLQHCPNGILAPDLALGYDYEPRSTGPTKERGLFLRRDSERRVSFQVGEQDPARMCRTPAKYLALASRYSHIITDRLHFAICGLLNRRRVTLLPNSYHKNRSLWETWLADLGCEWANDPREVGLENTSSVPATKSGRKGSTVFDSPTEAAPRGQVDNRVADESDELSLTDPYTEWILPHASKTSPFREAPANGSLRATTRNATCGDQVVISAAIGESPDKIVTARCEPLGCLISQAAAAILCEHLSGQPFSSARAVTAREMLELMRVPLLPRRRRCALLAWEAWQDIVRRFDSGEIVQ